METLHFFNHEMALKKVLARIYYDYENENIMKQLNLNQFSLFEPCFHDGVINKIENRKNEIVIWVETSELIEEEKIPGFIYTSENILKTVLYLKNPSKILVNDEPTDSIVNTFDYAQILELELKEHQLSLLLIWIKFVDGKKFKAVEQILIEFDEVYWINES